MDVDVKTFCNFQIFFVFRTEIWAFEGKKWQKHPPKIETFSPESSQMLHFFKILGHDNFLYMEFF